MVSRPWRGMGGRCTTSERTTACTPYRRVSVPTLGRLRFRVVNLQTWEGDEGLVTLEISDVVGRPFQTSSGQWAFNVYAGRRRPWEGLVGRFFRLKTEPEE